MDPLSNVSGYIILCAENQILSVFVLEKIRLRPFDDFDSYLTI